MSPPITRTLCFGILRYPIQTITKANYDDDIALLANTLVQAESLLHSLERAVGGIGLHVNADKTKYMCFNQRGNISTQKGGLLKLVDKFIYLRNSVSLTEKDIKNAVSCIEQVREAAPQQNSSCTVTYHPS